MPMGNKPIVETKLQICYQRNELYTAKIKYEAFKNVSVQHGYKLSKKL